MFFYLYKDANHQWRWTLFAANNRKIANCGEGYHNKQDAIHDIGLVMSTSSSTPIREG